MVEFETAVDRPLSNAARLLWKDCAFDFRVDRNCSKAKMAEWRTLTRPEVELVPRIAGNVEGIEEFVTRLSREVL